MKKKRVPILGFIGSILGSVVELLTSEDGEDYMKIIDELQDKKKQFKSNTKTTS